MKTVTINFLTQAEQDRWGVYHVTSRHRTSNPEEAVERAVRKLYGKGAWFLRDTGFSFDRYGQVYRSLDSQSATALSARLRIDTD